MDSVFSIVGPIETLLCYQSQPCLLKPIPIHPNGLKESYAAVIALRMARNSSIFNYGPLEILKSSLN